MNVKDCGEYKAGRYGMKRETVLEMINVKIKLLNYIRFFEVPFLGVINC